MKKNLLTIILCASAIFAKAQTITISNVQDIGETYTYNQDTLQYSQGPAGNSVVWNFSSVTFPPTLEYEYYVVPSTTIGGANFPTSNLAEGTAADTNFTYYSRSASSLQILGTVFGTQTDNYSNPATYLSLPMSFGNTFTDDFASTISGSFPLTITGTITGNADGAGTLTLPGSGGSVQALRLKLVINQLASAIIPPSTIPVTVFNIFLTQYMWFNPATKNVVFQLGRDSVIFSFPGSPTTTSTGFSVKNKVGMVLTGTQEYKIPNAVEVFPNPSFGKTRVVYSAKPNEQINVNVYDVSGKLIEK